MLPEVTSEPSQGILAFVEFRIPNFLQNFIQGVEIEKKNRPDAKSENRFVPSPSFVTQVLAMN